LAFIGSFLPLGKRPHSTDPPSKRGDNGAFGIDGAVVFWDLFGYQL
jgi:hypothetical protein